MFKKLLNSQRGSYYLEALIALGILAIISTYLLPLLPRLAKDSRQILIYSKINIASEYIGNYIHRWSKFEEKPFGLEFYENGDEFEQTEEKRVNRLSWAENISKSGAFSDEYKTSITLWELDSRLDEFSDPISAVVKIHVWYDENLNSLSDLDEYSFTFFTSITEPN
jgi:type II secretory pathway pseudopilin PulG